MLKKIEVVLIRIYWIELCLGEYLTLRSGHEDWSQCVESVYDSASKCLLVASGGQDHLIRVWRLAEVKGQDTVGQL